MPLNNNDWRTIQDFVNGLITQVGEPFIQSKVIRADPVRRVVFVKEFGDTPIPIITFDYRVRYQYVDPEGSTQIRYAGRREVEVLVPLVGDTVLIAQQFGSRRLPKCIGVVKSKRYVESVGE